MSTTSDLRNANMSILLQTLLKHGQLARYELADKTGLTRTSVSNVVTELLANGIVEETEQGQASNLGGRKPIMLGLSANAFTMIGLDLRRERVTGCLINLAGTILDKCSFPLQLGCSTEAVLEKLDRAINIFKTSSKLPILGIGLGSIGPLNKPLDFDAIQDINLTKILEEKHNIPVLIESGATAAAIGEYFWSIDDATRLRSLVFIEIDYRIGMGLVAGDLTWQTSGKGTSIGHMTINPEGDLCACGRRGCLDVYASGKTLLQDIDWAALNLTSQPDLSIVAELAEQGNQIIQKQIFEMGRHLGMALLSLDWLLYPERIVIGSSHAFLNKWYLEGIKNYVSQIRDEHSEVPLIDRISLASHGGYAIAYGAATMQLKAFFDSPQEILQQVKSFQVQV